MAVLMPEGKQSFTNSAGAPLVGGKVYTYDAGTSTPRVTYTDAAGTTPNTNPVILDARGEATIFWDGAYKIVLKDAADVTIWTVDNAISSNTAADTLRADLASSAVDKGDALVAVLRAMTGAVAETISTWIERQHIYVEEFGASEAASASVNAAAIQAAIDAASANKVGEVRLKQGAVYAVNALPVMKTGVTLNGNWGRLNAALGAGNIFGLRMANYSEVKNIKIYVTSTAPSSQFIFHAPISIGAPNNNGDTVAAPNAFQTVHDWVIRNVELGTDRQYAPVIQGMGDVYNGLIENVYIPSSATCSGVHFDWGNVGTVSSAAIAATKTSFLANQCYTTHPHNILIRNVACGVLSVAAAGDLGSNIVRLSACYNIRVENVYADSVTLTGYRHVGGDLGFEFAPAAVKYHACKGNTCKGMVIGAQQTNGTLTGVYIDTLADNVYSEQFLSGYVALLDPLMYGNVAVEDSDLPGANSDFTYGARITQARGVTLRRNQFQRWTYGVWVDEFVRDITVSENAVFSNRQSGIVVGFGNTRENTRDVTIEKNRVFKNGTDTTGRGCYVVRGHNIRIIDNIFGASDDTTQQSGVTVLDAGPANFGIVIKGNHCESATVGAWLLTSGTPSQPYMYRQVSCLENNTVHTRVPLTTGGQPYLPQRGLETSYNLPCREWLNPNSGAPTDGTWYRGEKLWQAGPSPASLDGHDVTTSGTFGVLAGLTNAATTNGSADVTMSLAARTATTTANSYTLTVSSTTNLRNGLKFSVAAAGLVDATILDITGTTITTDVPANATQAGGAFTTTGVIEGEVVSLNTTPAISGALVKKTVGTTVTLSASASSTEVGRTVSYTAPVFKALAAIAA